MPVSAYSSNLLSQKAKRIWEQKPGEKIAYRLRSKFEFEFQKISRGSLEKRTKPSTEQLLPKRFDGQATYSECLKDIFVLKVTGGKKNGTYLEIGSGPAVENNNTFLLEKNYAWNGLSIDFNPKFVQDFKDCRENIIELADATTFNYKEKLNYYDFPLHIDYLQIDIDPSYQSLRTLFQIPFSEFKFATITFEHDSYRTSKKIAFISRQKLRDEGYVLVAKNVLAKKGRPFEDWWVHPELVSIKNYKQFKSNRKMPKVFLKR